MTMNEVNSGQNIRPGIDYDTIVDNDYPRYGERPILYEPRKPVEMFETSPPPKEIVSAISLLKDYMVEGDAAIKKHKPKVIEISHKINAYITLIHYSKFVFIFQFLNIGGKFG